MVSYISNQISSYGTFLKKYWDSKLIKAKAGNTRIFPVLEEYHLLTYAEKVHPGRFLQPFLVK